MTAHTDEHMAGGWMQTYTGKQFFPLTPLPEDIDPLDIAHSLALQCRYNGHVDRFYSVAEHCVLMSESVPPAHALWALLHDAAEAYIGDMVRPLKIHMAEFRAVEDGILRAIVERFELSPATMPTTVKAADNRILLTERDALMTRHAPPGSWSVDGLKPLPVRITGWDPAYAQMRYTERLHELWGGTR